MSKRRSGKRIDHLTLDVDGVHQQVELRMTTGMYGERFYLCMNDPEMMIEGTDLKDLKERAKKFIRENCAVQWETWLEITVFDPDRFTSDRIHYEISIDWHRYEQGKTSDGRKIHRSVEKHDRHHVSFSGWPSEDKKWRFTTHIRETPEIVEALAEIGRRIEGIRVGLAALLSPKQIEATTSRLLESVANALPAPASAPSSTARHRRKE